MSTPGSSSSPRLRVHSHLNESFFTYGIAGNMHTQASPTAKQPERYIPFLLHAAGGGLPANGPTEHCLRSGRSTRLKEAIGSGRRSQ